MPAHVNSVLSFHGLNLGQRRAAVLAIYAEAGDPLTDRQAASRLAGAEFHDTKPRISELVEAGYLYEVDRVICEVTGKRVRRCTFSGLVSPYTP